jgi:hypothetical protein
MKRPAVVIGVALAAVLVLGLTAIVIGSLSRPGKPLSGPLSGPVDGVRAASFEVLDGAKSVRMRAGSLGDDLYRISVSSDTETRPGVDRDGGDVRLRLGGGDAVVDVVLNSSVTWTLRTTGGAREVRIDMSGAAADEIDLSGGASLLDVTLSRPSRLVMTGGADQFRVRLPSGTPVRVTASSGAGTVTLFGQSHQGVAAGQSFTANGWSEGAPGVDVQARAGVGVVIVDA